VRTLRSQAGQLIRSALVTSGVQLWRERRSPPVVIVYHGVNRDSSQPTGHGFIDRQTFEQHVRFLQRRRKIVSPRFVADCVRQGARIDRRWVAITFDDAFRDTALIVAEIMSAHDAPWMLNVPAGLLDTGRTLWPEELRIAARYFANELTASVAACAGLLSVDLGRHGVAGLIAYLLRSGEVLRRELFVQLESRLDADHWRETLNADARHRLLSGTELRQLAASGIEIGAHGYDHEALSDNLSATALKREVVDSRATLEALTGHAVRAFAFPFGIQSTAARQAVEKAGYSFALTSEHRGVTPETTAFTYLPRVLGEWPLTQLRFVLAKP